MHGVSVSMGKYLAFISYRHNTRDMEVSSGLRHGIENFHPGRKSSLPRKRKVFRDTPGKCGSTKKPVSIKRKGSVL